MNKNSQYKNKRNNLKSNQKRERKRIFKNLNMFILLLILSLTTFILSYKMFNLLIKKNIIIGSNIDNNGYSIIKKDKNKNYSGIGQEKIKNQDGYFTTFTTENNNKKIYKEYKQNGNASWANNIYWNSPMSESGCGITSLAIVLSGYNKNYNPEDLRKKYYPKMNYDNLSYELSNTFNVKNSNFYYDKDHLSNKSIIEHLKTNRPIIACLWNRPSVNRFTTTSHYVVLLATDGNMLYISNPNGLENSSKSSGWYKSSEIIPYIAKAIYIEEF